MQKKVILRMCLIVICGFLIVLLLKFFIPNEQKFAPYKHRVFLDQGSGFVQKVSLEEKLKRDPESFLSLGALASIYLGEAKKTGDETLFQRAEMLANRSQKLFSFHNDRAKLILADVAQAKHDFPLAMKLSQELISDPGTKRNFRIEALALLITSQLAMGRLDDADKSSNDLVDLDPSVSSFILRALVSESQGRDEEVDYNYHTAYLQEEFGNPVESARLRDFWARFSMRRGKYKVSADLLKESLRISPSDAFAFGLSGDLDLLEKQYDKASEHYERAFELSKQTLFLLNKSRAKELAGRHEEALQLSLQIEKILKALGQKDGSTGPSAYLHRSELIKLYLDRNDNSVLDLALDLARQEIKTRANSETIFLLASALYRKNLLLEARAASRVLLSTGVKQAEYFSLAADIENALQNSRKAAFYKELEKRVAGH